MLRQKLHQKRISHAVLARRIGRDQATVSKMTRRDSLQTYVIWELSVALRHNFFADLARQLDAATNGQLQQQQTELDTLRQEHERLKQERDYLRRAIDLMQRG